MCECWLAGVCVRAVANLASRIFNEIWFAMCYRCCYPSCIGIERKVDLNQDYEHPKRRQEFHDDSYKNVNRESAESLLAGKQNGTFIVRPSSDGDTLGTLSVQQDDRVFHLGIRRRRDGRMALGTPKPGEKCFKDLDALLNYHTSNYLILVSDRLTTTRTLLLPYIA